MCLMLLWNVGHVIKPNLERVSTDVLFVRWKSSVCITPTFSSRAFSLESKLSFFSGLNHLGVIVAEAGVEI